MNYKNRPNIPSHAIIFTLQLLLFLILPLVQAREDPLASPETNPTYKSNNNRSDSSLMVMIIILFIGFCVIFTISICILQCSSDSSPLEAHEAFAGIAKSDHRGLQQSEIDLLPKFPYSEVKQLKIGTTLLECAVCLTEFNEVETLRLLPKCNHVFHAECIDFWLVGHDTCPVCRANIILNLAESIQKERDQSEVGNSKLSYEHHHVQVNIEELEKKAKLPRPHSTGHLMARPGSDDLERFTLRLPNEVRLRLFRTTNLVALGGVSSSLRGYRSEGSGSSHYDGFLSRAGRQYKWTLPL